MQGRQNGFAVWNMNDTDYVAAQSEQEAIEFYMAVEGVPRSLIYIHPPQLSIDDRFCYIDTEESKPRFVTYRQLIREAIADNLEMPCIIVSFIIPRNGTGTLGLN